jgi:hypothetical protein
MSPTLIRLPKTLHGEAAMSQNCFPFVWACLIRAQRRVCRLGRSTLYILTCAPLPCIDDSLLCSVSMRWLRPARGRGMPQERSAPAAEHSRLVQTGNHTIHFFPVRDSNRTVIYPSRLVHLHFQPHSPPTINNTAQPSRPPQPEGPAIEDSAHQLVAENIPAARWTAEVS